MEEKITIPHLGILVTTFCNLNCRNCADLIPKRKSVNYDIKDVKEDMGRLLNEIDFIKEILIIGGETLLYPQLDQIIDYCAAERKIGKIIITTNGTIKPKEKILKCLADNEVCVRISGYPDIIAPKREEIIDEYKNNKIEIDNLEGMYWNSIGNTEFRDRNKDQLMEVFSSCEMAYCVTLQKDGLIFYCSRQLSAYETDIYPSPHKNEYINVRKSDNLKQDIMKFYELPYLSTCNYCDGISCANKEEVLIPASQILKKSEYLYLLEISYKWQENNLVINSEDLEYVNTFLLDHKKYFYDKVEYIECLRALESVYYTDDFNRVAEFAISFKNLVDSLAEDYTYNVNIDVLGSKKYLEYGKNVITVGNINTSDKEDLLVSNKEIISELYQRYPIDPIEYNKIYIESQVNLLRKGKVECVVCGLSYTQYGFLNNIFPLKSVNLSVTGQDIPYSLLMAKYSLKINPKIKLFIIPIAYYQGGYDISSDDADLHKQIVERIDIPILGDNRNYSREKGKEKHKKYWHRNIFDQICDFEKLKEYRNQEFETYLEDKEYFNERFHEPIYGGLKFDFKDLDDNEKLESAKITAELNERVISENGYNEVVKYINEVVPQLVFEDRKVIFFTPPTTKYLNSAYSESLKKRFYKDIVQLLKKFAGCIYIDLSEDKAFLDEDFCDFEHLNNFGAKKLTKILSDYATEL